MDNVQCQIKTLNLAIFLFLCVNKHEIMFEIKYELTHAREWWHHNNNNETVNDRRSKELWPVHWIDGLQSAIQGILPYQTEP